VSRWAPPWPGAAPGTAAARILVLAAHPDDETIGGSLVLRGARDVAVVHLTDGAPREARFRPAGVGAPAAYAEARRAELGRALDVAGIPADRRIGLGLTDQECAAELPALVRRLLPIVESLRPDVILTHAYEGGHPDHDAAALAASLAAALVARAGGTGPERWEMALYHGGPGRLVTCDFLPRAGDERVTAHLSDEQRRAKGRMLDCFATQRALLAQFPDDVERFRPAPPYDFTRPPHPGPLWYEQLGWPLSGGRWRELAQRAMAELGVAP
jgi:LmbE family N-acetylglucosaminyl deacetylase